MLAATIVIREGEEMPQQAPWTEGLHMRTAAIGTTNQGWQEAAAAAAATVRMPIAGLNTRGRDTRTRTDLLITGKEEGTTERGVLTSISKTYIQDP